MSVNEPFHRVPITEQEENSTSKKSEEIEEKYEERIPFEALHSEFVVVSRVDDQFER